MKKSSIGPTESRLDRCSVCDEQGHIVAEDYGTGGVYCEDCIIHALNAEIAMRTIWRGMGVRHPVPSEFVRKEDR